MSSTTLVSLRVPEVLAKRLKTLASAMHCPRSYLTIEAIEEYLDLHEWQIKGIQAGLKDITEGKVRDLEMIKKEWNKK